ncbi:sigma-70 family RNA polymerase sigma factor [Arthrobacter sp. 31Y]|uniref:sigma-70 family RNA polymerase sigma factor n=1 Tax=Arthrobacter sp. 31Y TaxID=1115632 RepID=UPI00046467B8|nr:sigma-70 family RNA polymerase sigma factor [Arthrobacter sp. 31Y]
MDEATPTEGTGQQGKHDGGTVAVEDSDAQLILLVRSGDQSAFETLFARHRSSARAVAAAQLDNFADVDDVVADAFTSVYQSLAAGKGPDTFFRAYLLTTVRRVAHRINRDASRTSPTSESYILDTVDAHDDPAVAKFESTAVAQAFRSLPERWQEVLWYVDIEGLKPAAASPLLGLTPNGVSALALRARERLRQAYLQNHISSSAGKDCEEYSTQLGAYSREGLSPRNQGRVQEHLEGCPQCTALLLDLNDVQTAMRVWIFPLVTGVAFSSAFPGLAGAGAGSTVVEGGASTVVGGPDVGGTVIHGVSPKGISLAWKVGIGVIAVAAVAASAAMAFGGAGSDTSVPPKADAPPVAGLPSAPELKPPISEDTSQEFPLVPDLNDPYEATPEKPVFFPFPPSVKPEQGLLPYPGKPLQPSLQPLPTFAPSGPPTLPVPQPTPSPSPTPAPSISASPTPSATPTPAPSPDPSETSAPAPAVTATFTAEEGTTASDTNVTVTFQLKDQAAVPGSAQVVFAISAGTDMIPGKLVEPAGWTCSKEDAATTQFRCISTAVDPDDLTFLLGVSKQDEAEVATLDYSFSGSGIETVTFSNTF